jgi:hypothetical protein
VLQSARPSLTTLSRSCLLRREMLPELMLAISDLEQIPVNFTHSQRA